MKYKYKILIGEPYQQVEAYLLEGVTSRKEATFIFNECLHCLYYGAAPSFKVFSLLEIRKENSIVLLEEGNGAKVEGYFWMNDASTSPKLLEMGSWEDYKKLNRWAFDRKRGDVISN